MTKELLDIYSDYLISQNQYATATDLATLLDGKVSHGQVSRFLREEDYGSKELWGYIKSAVRQMELYCWMIPFMRKVIPMKML